MVFIGLQCISLPDSLAARVTEAADHEPTVYVINMGTERKRCCKENADERFGDH